MKLVTFAVETRILVGEVEGDWVYGLAFKDTMRDLIQRNIRPTRGHERFKADAVRYLVPVRPNKIICVGRNYADHAAELGNAPPPEPLLFPKFSTSLVGPDAPIRWSTALTQQVDWEGELAVIIGKGGKNIAAEQAMAHVFGYSIANDVTARDLQKQDSQWTRAKGMDTFAPLGPYIVTKDDISDPHALHLQTHVNGELMQDAHTSSMIFKIPELIAFASRAFTLESGDVILTGTPAGVGNGRKPPRFLADGDVVAVTIEGLGTLRNPCQISE
jgi:2-keto-4-pentenoate hydratase/2-oxohepta-3-ene-1,7-dioic acid hydratase in catechol pathway